jgi:hypothetical protein
VAQGEGPEFKLQDRKKKKSMYFWTKLLLGDFPSNYVLKLMKKRSHLIRRGYKANANYLNLVGNSSQNSKRNIH